MKRRLAVDLLRLMPGALGLLLRQKFYPRLFGSCGRKVVFGRGLTLENPSKIHLGDGAVLSDYVGLEAAGADIKVGEGAFLGIATSIRSEAGEITLEEGVNLGSGCTLHPKGRARVGRHTLFAAFCELGGGETPEPIDIGEGCWLGVRVAVIEGVAIGNDAIVGAHSTVEDHLPARSISVGSPAQVTRTREAS